MSALQRVATIIGYEWRRSVAKKRIAALAILVFAVQIVIFVIFNYLFTSPLTNLPPLLQEPLKQALEETRPLMWVVEVLAPQGLFMSLVAIIIAGGSMSEEYEHGTADILLSKPITRVEYLIGKYLGALSLLSFVSALTTIVGVVLAVVFFSPQESLLFIPHVYLAVVYSNLVFLSLAFMFSEVLRRTTLAYLSAIGVFVGSTIIGGVLSSVHNFTGEAIYLDASKWLPNWSVSNFPNFVMGELLDAPSIMFASLEQGDILLAGALIAIYTIIFIALAIVKLVRSDITKKAD